MINRLCSGKLETLTYASGPQWKLSLTDLADQVKFDSGWILAFSRQHHTM